VPDQELRTDVDERRQAASRREDSVRSVREPPDVLIVEDDVELAGMLRFAIESAGYSVEVHDTGPDALEALLALSTTGAPRLLLLGIDLPGMDGHTLHEQLRAARPGRFIVAFHSDRGSDADQIRALTGGAVDYLVRPVSIPVLLLKIEVWFGACSGRA
jgi:two-component system, OmpR family, phosphate regulon response regulator PhoB